MNTNSIAPPAQDAAVLVLTGAPSFELGKIVATPGALAFLGRHGVDPKHIARWHEQCQWGSLDKDDVAANHSALKDGSRIFSCYDIGGDKVWVITEAIGEDGSRSCTTLLLASEY